MYADYDYYQTEYGGKMSADDFKRFSRRAEHRIDGITGNKLQFAFPTNERDVEAVKDCVCELADFLYRVDSYENMAMDSAGMVTRADGMVIGKVVTSITDGTSSRSFSTGGSANTSVSKAAESEKELEAQVYDKVSTALRGVYDANGVRMLNAEIPYPGKRGYHV